jgi:hypothetical protein
MLSLQSMVVGDPLPPPPDPGPAGDGIPWVWITASDATGSESGDPIEFTVWRTEPIDDSLVVYLFPFAGTATPGALPGDYTGSLSSFVIGGGEDHASFTITPGNDTSAELTESVIPILKADTAYRLALGFLAGAALADDENPTSDITVSKIRNNAADGNLPEASEVTPGAFLPVNNDDDDYDAANKADSTQVVLATHPLVVGEDDVLPIVVKKVAGATGGKYRLTLPKNIRAFDAATKKGCTTVVAVHPADWNGRAWLHPAAGPRGRES